MTRDEQSDRELALRVAQLVCVEGKTRKEVLRELGPATALRSETGVTRQLQRARDWGMVTVADPQDRDEEEWPVNDGLGGQLSQAIGVTSHVVDIPAVERLEKTLAQPQGVGAQQIRQELSLLDDRITGALARAAAQMVALQPPSRADLFVLSSGGRTPVFFAARLGALTQGRVAPGPAREVRVAPLSGDIGALPWSYASWLTLGPFNRCDANTASFLLALAYRAPEVPFLFVPGAAEDGDVATHLKELKGAVSDALEPGRRTLAIVGLGRLAGAHRYMLSGDEIREKGPLDSLQSQLQTIRELGDNLSIDDPILDAAGGALLSRLRRHYDHILPFGDVLNVVFPLGEGIISRNDQLWDAIAMLNRRIVSVPPTYLSQIDQVVLIAGGPLKYPALRMFVRLRHDGKSLVNMLVTDRACAAALLKEAGESRLAPLEVEDVVPGLSEMRRAFDEL